MGKKQMSFPILFLFGSKLASLVKVSFVIGSYATFFSLSPMVVPLAGAFGGIAGSTLLGLLMVAVRSTYGLGSLAFLAHSVPGLFGGYYWASRSVWVRLFIPLSCMVLFMCHPIGITVWYYALYWLIPVIVYFVSTPTLFCTALGSTFVAHAVGSIIWLYTVPMTAVDWHHVMPLVLIERLCFAVGMVLMYKAVQWIMAIMPAMRINRAVVPEYE